MTKDTKRKIELSQMMATFHFLKWQEASYMVDAVSYFSEGDEKFMWESLLYWAETRADLKDWWDKNSGTYLQGIAAAEGKQ